MQITDPTAELPRREQESQLTHGGRLLTITVWRQSHVLKGGEVRYKRHTVQYLVERPSPGQVRLVKDDGAAYVVTGWNCDCPDTEFKGKERWCKHRSACAELGLLATAKTVAAN